MASEDIRCRLTPIPIPSVSPRMFFLQVRVNAVAPGIIDTSGLDRYDPAVQSHISANAAVTNYAGRLGIGSG